MHSLLRLVLVRRSLLHCKFSGNVWSLCDHLLDWNRKDFAVVLGQSIPVFFFFFFFLWFIFCHKWTFRIQDSLKQGTPAIRLNIWMREFQLIYYCSFFYRCIVGESLIYNWNWICIHLYMNLYKIIYLPFTGM